MTTERIKELRTELQNETISYSELAEIEQAFEEYELNKQFPYWELDQMLSIDKLSMIGFHIYKQGILA